MATDIDMCNLALSFLGANANIQSIVPPDGSAESDHAARFYPMARRSVLQAHAWGFATRRLPLAGATLGLTDLQPPGWSYVYEKPSQCLQIISVLEPSSASTVVPGYLPTSVSAATLAPADQKVNDFIEETLQGGTPVIYTNVYAPILRYVVDVTDTTKFPPLMSIAVARLLASYLAGPIIKGEEGRKESESQLKRYQTLDLPAATGADGQGRRVSTYEQSMPAPIKARQ